MLHINFIEAVPSDFVGIPTGGHHDGCYDLTRLFRVPTAGEDKVTLDLTTSAFLHSGGTTLEEALGESHPQAHDLPSLMIQSEPINMNLVESQPTLQRRAERFRPGDCNGNQDVTNARNNAKDLARHAQGSGNAVLWELYFNDGDQRATISNAYQGVQNYDPASNKYSITEQCGFQNQDFDCRTNARIAAYAAGPFPDGSHIIIFSTFFALPKKLTCEFPSFAFHGMLDQGGTFLHELLHVESLAGVRINDGVNKCYSWECITKAAKPDNGGEDHPWYIAKSYEAYAYAARALGTRECNVDEAKVTAPYNGAQRAIANTNNECEPGIQSCLFDNIAVAGTPAW